jgi:hypothetical protein
VEFRIRDLMRIDRIEASGRLSFLVGSESFALYSSLPQPMTKASFGLYGGTSFGAGGDIGRGGSHAQEARP